MAIAAVVVVVVAAAVVVVVVLVVAALIMRLLPLGRVTRKPSTEQATQRGGA